ILFNLGGELSLPDEKLIEKGYIERLEQLIDSYNNDLPPLKEFILPGGGRSASICHLARAVCRRAERSVVKLAGSESVNRYSQTYLNRLSDLLFVVARLLARRAGGTEVYWDKHRL
ncbi:MAG: cob(I)yrinic acid a,c-diamide adenosyltransferase, partial [Gammaproteobacteria bacterium]